MILKVELTQPDLEMAVRLFLKHEHGLNIPPEGDILFWTIQPENGIPQTMATYDVERETWRTNTTMEP